MKRAVAMARRVVGEDAGNGKGGKSNGNGCAICSTVVSTH